MPKTTKPKVTANGAAMSPLDVLTLGEAAAYLRLPEDAVREEAESGRLVGRHVRGQWRFARAAVVEWLHPARELGRPATGAELVERIREINRRFGVRATPAEIEEELAEVRRVRKSWSAS